VGAVEEAVSVVIPCYNRSSTLGRAIKSVLDQSYQDFEIIVVDDASTDPTDEVVKNIKDGRITYIRHQNNQGAPAARNSGLRIAKHPYIAFLDSDDEWLPQKLEKQMDLFSRRDGSFGVVYTGFNIFDSEGKFIRSYIAHNKGHILQDLLVENYVATLSTIVVRREYLEKVGGFDVEMKSCQDWDLCIRLSGICQFDCVEELLVNYFRLEDANRISTNMDSVVRGHLRIQNKFRASIDSLPRHLKLRHLNYFDHLYINHGNLGLSLEMLREAARISGNPWFLMKMAKRVLTHSRNKS
jgi:glycosyltransferase involved in cell wall biosynthesis